jgi:hypothetical protein
MAPDIRRILSSIVIGERARAALFAAEYAGIAVESAFFSRASRWSSQVALESVTRFTRWMSDTVPRSACRRRRAGRGEAPMHLDNRTDFVVASSARRVGTRAEIALEWSLAALVALGLAAISVNSDQVIHVTVEGLRMGLALLLAR